MIRLRPWVRSIAGAIVIVGTFALLWIEFGPRPAGGVEHPPPPALFESRAVVRVTHPGLAHAATATITCDGAVRQATGFWAHDPREACDALASTGPALVAGPGCRVTTRRTLRLEATGTFHGRSFTHRQQRGGCPDADGWLAVNVLAKPLVVPEQKVTEGE